MELDEILDNCLISHSPIWEETKRLLQAWAAKQAEAARIDELEKMKADHRHKVFYAQDRLKTLQQGESYEP